MSQKYVVGIVATSFVAGLLATAIVHGPQELSKADYPYFGFADESAGAATGMLGESKSWWRPTVLPSPDQPVVAGQPAKSWMSWNTLADATRQFFRRHFSQGQSPVVSRPAAPPPEQFLAGKTAASLPSCQYGQCRRRRQRIERNKPTWWLGCPCLRVDWSHCCHLRHSLSSRAR